MGNVSKESREKISLVIVGLFFGFFTWRFIITKLMQSKKIFGQVSLDHIQKSI